MFIRAYSLLFYIGTLAIISVHAQTEVLAHRPLIDIGSGNRSALTAQSDWVGGGLCNGKENSTEENGSLDVSDFYDFKIDWDKPQSCDWFGPFCQPGSVTISSRSCAGYTSTFVDRTYACSDYLTAQASVSKASAGAGMDNIVLFA